MNIKNLAMLAALFICGSVAAQEALQQKTVIRPNLTESQKSEIENLINDYTNKIKDNPENLKLYETRAALLMVLKDYEAAIADYDFIIDKDDKIASWFYFRGLCKLSLQDLDTACADIKKAKELNYDFNNGELLMFCAQ